MPEHRGRTYHRARVGETLKEEIGVIIEGELGDPRIALCTVTEIALAPDGKSARVYIEVAGDEREQEQTITAINAARARPPNPSPAFARNSRRFVTHSTCGMAFTPSRPGFRSSLEEGPPEHQ